MAKTENPLIDKTRLSVPTNYSFVRTLALTVLCALSAGLVASLVATFVMGILRLFAGIPTPVELFGDFVLKRLDANTFVGFLIRFAPNPKTTPLGLTLLAMIAVGTLLGLVYAVLVRIPLPTHTYRPGRREWGTALGLALVLTLVGIALFHEDLRQNQFGFIIFWSTVLSIVGLLADFIAYGVVLCLAYRILLPKQESRVDAPVQSRRLLLSRAGVAVLGVGAGAGTLGTVKGFLAQFASYDGFKTSTPNQITPPITPNNLHYVVTQNTVDPTPNIDLWRLEVTGLVRNPGSYTFDEVQQLPSTSRAITLECIANGPGGHLMSTAVWQGVTLRTLLEKHGGALPNASYVAFYSVDGYTVSQPLDEVLSLDSLLAWRMNGSEIPMRHGYPMRVLIPGRYGEENPKWLTRVELTDHFVSGLYSDQGWYNGPIHITSRIDRPTEQIPVGQPTEVGGIAYGGSKGIQKVEVSTDGGTTWNIAILQPPISQDAWVLWTWQWTPAQAGMYTVVVRCTDGTGQLQTSNVQSTVPNGGEGYHKVKVTVM